MACSPEKMTSLYKQKQLDDLISHGYDVIMTSPYELNLYLSKYDLKILFLASTNITITKSIDIADFQSKYVIFPRL